MKTYVITCTGDRPEALHLCNHYMARQSHQDFTWIVVDDGEEKIRPRRCNQYLTPPKNLVGGASLLRNLRLGLMQVLQAPGPEPDDLVLLVEDDDWYHAGYVGLMQNCATNLPPGVELFGESHTRYYNVRWRTYRHNDNSEWASLCATCLKASFIPTLLEICQNADPERPFVDVTAFQKHSDKAFLFSTDLVCGIKGMPGRKGIGHGHTEPCKRLRRDPYLDTLQQWIGVDVDRYREFYHDEEMRDVPIHPEDRMEPWALAEERKKSEGYRGACVIFRQAGITPDLSHFAAGAFAHGYLNEIRDIADARLSHFPPADLVVISGGCLRHGGLNGAVFDHYRSLGVPVVICDPGRIVKGAQRVYINKEHWIPPEECSRDRMEPLGLIPSFKPRGEKILIAGQRPDLDNQLKAAIAMIRTVSDREIVFRPHPNMYHQHQREEYDVPFDRLSFGEAKIDSKSIQSLNDDLDDAWCVVTHSSIVGVTAMLRGIPVFASDEFVGIDAAYPLNYAPQVEKMERPSWDALNHFLRRLSYSIWYEGELRSGKAFDYLKRFIKKEQP
jgi:hypothetical protein